MGTNLSRTQYEGILIMDRRPSMVNAANSTFTEDAPQVGPITADAGFETEAIIVASGTPTDGDPLLLRGMKAGSPGVNRAGFAWRETTATKWYGWDMPSVITAFEFVEDATSDSVGFPHPQPIPLANGKIVIVAGDDTNGNRGVSKRVRETDGTYGASVTLFTESRNFPGDDRLHPRGVLLESGRMLVYHMIQSPFIGSPPASVNDEIQIRMMYSDAPDTDSTYREGETGVLRESFDLDGGSFDRLRVAYSPDTGQFLLTIEHTTSGGSSRIFQYASRSGVYFEQVGVAISCNPSVGHDVEYVDGFFVLLFSPSGGAPDPTFGLGVRRTASAFTALSSSPEIIPPFAVARTGSGLSLVASDDKQLYIYGRTGIFGFGVSDDAGRSWLSNPGDGIRFAGSGVLFSNHSAAFYRGYVYLIGNQTAPAANILALTATRMGGYSDLTLPPEAVARNIGRQMWWEEGWVGHDSPASGVPFTDGSIGVPLLARATDGSWLITTGVGDTAKYFDTAASSVDAVEFLSWCRVKRNTGQFTLEITNDNQAPAGNSVQFEFDSDLRLVDKAGAVVLATAVAPGAGLDLFFATSNDSVTAWYSVFNNGDHKRTWVKLISSALGPTPGGFGRRLELRVEPSSSVNLYGVQWSRVGAVGSSQILVGKSMADDVTLPDDLMAKSLPAAGVSYVNDDVSIRGIDGPLLRGTEFAMELTHPHPIENIFPFETASPRVFWLSSDDSADQEIAIRISTNNEEAHAGSDTIGIYIGNSNVQHIRVEGRDAGGAFNLLTDIERGETGLAYIRDGNTVYPDKSNTSIGQYYHRDELAGSYFICDAGSGDTRTIVGNTEGNFTSGAVVAEKRCIIYLELDEVDGTEATAGTTGVIVHRDTMTTLALRGNNTFRMYKITCNDTATGAVDSPPGGKLRIGTMPIGPMIIFGKRQDADYTTTRAAQVETEELSDGTMRTRILAPSRRTVVVNFNDGVDVTQVRGAKDSNYVQGSSGSGAEPIANTRDLPLMLEGLIDQLDGPSTLVVYVPNMPATTGPGNDATTFRAGRAGGAVYGRIIGGVTASAVFGDPMLTEVLTGPSLTIREEV